MSGEPDRDDDGRYRPSKDVSDDDILRAVKQHEPASTREVADELGIPRRSALRYLDDLADTGSVSKKKIDERRAVWMAK